MYRPDQIDIEPTKGRLVDHWLYRRLELAEGVAPGIVRYEPQLEDIVDNVPGYIAEHLNRLASEMSERWVLAALHPANAVTTLQIPLPNR
jgi:hypothetical protein